MIMRFGMSEKLGPRVLGRNHDMPFLGREMGAEPDYSEEIAKEIDDEIRRVIEEAHDKATTRAARAHGRAAPALGDPDRARDDRQGPVRAAARRRARGVGLRGGGAAGRRAASPSPSAEKKPVLKPSPRALPGAAMQPPRPTPPAVLAASAGSVRRARASALAAHEPAARARPPQTRADGLDRRAPGIACEVDERASDGATRATSAPSPSAGDPARGAAEALPGSSRVAVVASSRDQYGELADHERAPPPRAPRGRRAAARRQRADA